MEQPIILTLFISLVSSSAVFGLIQFLITRHDNKTNKFGKIENDLKKIKEHLQTDIAEIYDKIESLSMNFERSQAISARTRILSASDEIRHGTNHSKEFYDQLSEDITFYQQYCKDNPHFENNRAVQAINSINDIYVTKLKTNDFL